jgi:presenilin-like A22 family membrane protease
MLTLAGGVMEMRVPVVLVVPLTLEYSFPDADLPGPVAEGDQSGEDPDADEDGDAEEERTGADSGEDVVQTESEEDEEDGDPLDREALFVGLGDAVIPTVLVASAAFFAPGSVPSLGVPGIALTLPTLTAMLGTFAGLLVLLWLVLKGRAHAGLPLLNGGTVLGYLAGARASGGPHHEALGLSGLL